MSLEDIFRYIEAKEVGKRSANKLLSHGVESTRSQYKRNKTEASKNRLDPTRNASYCGKTGHGDHPRSTSEKRNVQPLIRSVNIAIASTTWKVCAEPRQEHQATNMQYSTIFVLTDLKKPATISLDHHTYN